MGGVCGAWSQSDAAGAHSRTGERKKNAGIHTHTHTTKGKRQTRLLELRDVQEALLLHEAGELRHDCHVLGDIEGVRPEGGEAVGGGVWG